ncbi:hypothetical protein [Halomontanus rarus]|uniref:hypothetical protein n=1 Tax=Halomontanus rarus TaxID=3034020 RepID=UPI0023E7F834|nr:hypothetical protein [Halovivax sp. TS33]
MIEDGADQFESGIVTTPPEKDCQRCEDELREEVVPTHRERGRTEERWGRQRGQWPEEELLARVRVPEQRRDIEEM